MPKIALDPSPPRADVFTVERPDRRLEGRKYLDPKLPVNDLLLEHRHNSPGKDRIYTENAAGVPDYPFARTILKGVSYWSKRRGMASDMWLFAAWILWHWTGMWSKEGSKITDDKKKNEWKAAYADFWWNWAQTGDLEKCPVPLPLGSHLAAATARRAAPPAPAHSATGVAFATTLPVTRRAASLLQSQSGPANAQRAAAQPPQPRPTVARQRPPRPDPARFPDGVPARLPNVGQTCFMNAALQCLYAIEPLRAFFLADDFMPEDRIGRLTPERLRVLGTYRALQRAMQDDNERDLQVILPNLLDSLGRNIRKTTDADGKERVIRTRTFSTGTQEDTGEFVIALLDDLHEGLHDLSGEEATIINSQFSPTFRQTITCHNCRHSEVVDHTTGPVFPLAADSDVTDGRLESYIAAYTPADEALSDWECPQCSFLRDSAGNHVRDAAGKLQLVGRRPATKSLIWSEAVELPHFLIFQFGTYALRGGTVVKSVPDSLTFPQELHIGPEMRGISPETRYSLVGTAAHGGQLSGGHFVAKVRMGDQWFHCNDDTIEVSGSGAAQNGRTPYLFVYKRL
jgi:ubiquitin C-terminal hydrolase